MPYHGGTDIRAASLEAGPRDLIMAESGWLNLAGKQLRFILNPTAQLNKKHGNGWSMLKNKTTCMIQIMGRQIWLPGFLLLSLLAANAENLINVKVAGGAPGAPNGTAVIGTAGDTWNYFPNLNGLANGGGVVTNATTIKDSSGATLSGVAMTMSLSGGNGLNSFSDTSSFSPAPSLILGNYVYQSTGANYWTFNFTGLTPNKTYMLYGMGNGNASGQGTTWWVDVANGHATASASANFSNGTRDATQATNQGICWVQLPATTTAAGALTFRVVLLGGTESGTGGSGRAYLNGFQLQPLSAPIITSLVNQTVIAGTMATLSPAISGVPAPSYQWRSNNVAITGGTSASLVLNNVQFSQNGVIYSLVASNIVGKVTNSMTLNVIVTPSITGLNNQAVSTGATVTMSPTVSGVPNPATSWFFGLNNLSDGATGNGSTISGSATSTLIINNAQAADSGTYSLIATNSAGMVTNSMTLTVSSGNVAPSITGPADQTAVQTSNATFTAPVSGLPLSTLQWQVNGAPILDQTNSSLTVSNVQYSQNGFVYSLVASNVAGMATNSANLFVLVPPSISMQPTNLVVTNTQSATFTVTASDVPAPGYQWYFNSNLVSGVTTSNYFIANVSPANIGNYFVIVSNSVGSVTSSVVTLTVDSTMSPTILTPTNGSTGVCYDTPLYITFSSPPVLTTPGTGKIRIYNVTNSTTPVDTLDMSKNVTISSPYAVNTQPYTNGPNVFTEFPVIITSNTVAIYPHLDLLRSNQTYYVAIDNTVFTDTNGAYFVGITATNAWKFTTKIDGAVNPTNLIVAQDYSGDFATVQGAIDSVPSGNSTPTIINLHNGTYTEVVLVYNKNKITFRGQSRSGARIAYRNNNILNPGSSLLSVFKANTANDIAVENLTITNLTPQSVAQAFALMVDAGSARFICNNAEISGYQDTIFINQPSQTTYFNNSLIQGDVDYIWGSGVGFFTNCQLNTLRATGGYVTQPRAPVGGNGFSFVNCSFTVPNSSYHNSVFARAIGVANGNTVLVNCRVDTNGYTGWTATDVTNTSLNLRWWEYGNSNLLATAPAVFNGTQLASNDPNLTNARNATLWLGGWTPALAPNILSQPTNESVNGGQQISLAVGATGVPDPTYQWKSNGMNIFGATNAALNFAATNVTNSGVYSVIVSNANGTMLSSNAVVTVANTAPAFTPVSDQTINAGVILSITNIVTDPDVPPQTLTFGLLTNPFNSTLNAAGVFNWRPSANQGGTTNPVSVEVTDNGTPNLSATNNFKIIVNRISRPSLGTISYNGTQLSFAVNGGTVGPDYVVEVSTNLIGWQNLLTSNSPPQPFTFADATISGASTKFYRVRLSP
jgi:pectin methylesterase-like acyl-CoA thioesterase